MFFSLGCGTGKYLSVNSQVYTLGCDYCEPLVEIARKKGDEVLVCDNLNLPFRDQCFNAVISIGGKTTYLHSGPQQMRIFWGSFSFHVSLFHFNLFGNISLRITADITEMNVVNVEKKS